MKKLTSILIGLLLTASAAFAGIGSPQYNPSSVSITGGAITGINYLNIGGINPTVPFRVTSATAGRTAGIDSTGSNGAVAVFSNSGTDFGVVGSDKWANNGNLGDFFVGAMGTGSSLLLGANSAVGLSMTPGGTVTIYNGLTVTGIVSATNSLGVTSHAVPGSRVFGTTYTNTTGRTMVVMLTGTNGSVPQMQVDGVNSCQITAATSNCTLIVPNGSTYGSTASGGTVTIWNELY